MIPIRPSNTSTSPTSALSVNPLEIFPGAPVPPNNPRQRAPDHHRTLSAIKYNIVNEISDKKHILPNTTDLLHSLRSTTLLDYHFMREVAATKRTLAADQNLSRLSANSVYNIHLTQIKLDKYRRPFSTRSDIPSLGNRTTKCGSEVRAPERHTSTPLKQDHSAQIPHFITEKYTQIQQTFPPLWKTTEVTQSPSRTVPKSLRQRLTKKSSQPLTIETVTVCQGHLLEQDISSLMQETGYNRTELYGLWIRFKALCSLGQSPHGLDKATFHQGIPHLSVEDQFFIDRIYQILDIHGPGRLEWKQFIRVIGTLKNGDLTNRVKFLFTIYDLNGDGVIQRTELVQFLLASLLLQPTSDVLEMANHVVNNIFTAMNCSDREVMQVEDTLQYMIQHPAADLYALFGRTMPTYSSS